MENKSKHGQGFTLKKGTIPDIKLNNTPVSQIKSVKYLGLRLDLKFYVERKKHVLTYDLSGPTASRCGVWLPKVTLLNLRHCNL